MASSLGKGPFSLPTFLPTILHHGDGHTYRENGMWRWRQKSFCFHQPRKAKYSQQTPEARERSERGSPSQGSEGAKPSQTLISDFNSLWSFKPPSLWDFALEAWANQYSWSYDPGPRSLEDLFLCNADGLSHTSVSLLLHFPIISLP